MLQGSDLEKNNMQNLKGLFNKGDLPIKHNLRLFLYVGKANRIDQGTQTSIYENGFINNGNNKIMKFQMIVMMTASVNSGIL